MMSSVVAGDAPAAAAVAEDASVVVDPGRGVAVVRRAAEPVLSRQPARRRVFASPPVPVLSRTSDSTAA